MKSINKAKSDFFYLQVIVIIWGFTGIIGRFSELTAENLTAGRLFIASIFLATIFLIRNIFRKDDPKKLKSPTTVRARPLLLAIFAGLLVALHWTSFFQAIKISNVSTALTCMSSAGLFSSLLEAIFLYRSKPSKTALMLSVTCILGIFFIYADAISNLEGMLLAILSAFLAAAFTTINAYLQNTIKSSLNISLIEMISGALCCVVLSDLDWGAIFQTHNSYNLVTILVLGVICTAIPFMVSVKIMRSITPSTLCISLNLEPIYAIILASLLFKEQEMMGVNFFIGATVVFLSAIFNGLTFKKASNASLPEFADNSGEIT